MSNELYKRIGERIRTAREGRFSQAELARRLGYTQAAVSRFELGKRAITLPDLEKIGDLLGKPLAYFLYDTATLQPEPMLTRMMEQFQVSVLPVYHHSPEAHTILREPPAEYLTFPNMLLKGADFAVRVRGDSTFEPDIRHDDIVLVRRQAHAEDGHYVVILLDDSEYSLRRYQTAKEWEQATRSKIVGRVVRLVRDM